MQAAYENFEQVQREVEASRGEHDSANTRVAELEKQVQELDTKVLKWKVDGLFNDVFLSNVFFFPPFLFCLLLFQQ